jgi:hypothetical protein
LTSPHRQLDVNDHLSQEATIVVTDITTLDALLHAPTALIGHVFHNTKKLNITLNLPMDVLTAIELQSTRESLHDFVGDCPNKQAVHQAASWLRLGPALGHLENLTKCHFWLDHSYPEYWWKFNEAAILAPLLSLAARDDVELTVTLPSHANDDVPTPPFKVHRRSRQHCFGVEIDGRLRVTHNNQFPILEAMAVAMNRLEDSMSLRISANEEERRKRDRRIIEAVERKLWRKGVNMKKHLDKLIETLPQFYLSFLQSN